MRVHVQLRRDFNREPPLHVPPCDPRGPAGARVSGKKVEGSNRASVVTNPHTLRFSAAACGCRDCLSVVSPRIAFDFRSRTKSHPRRPTIPEREPCRWSTRTRWMPSASSCPRSCSLCGNIQLVSKAVDHRVGPCRAGGTCREHVCVYVRVCVCVYVCMCVTGWEKWEMCRMWRDFPDKWYLPLRDWWPESLGSHPFVLDRLWYF